MRNTCIGFLRILIIILFCSNALAARIVIRDRAHLQQVIKQRMSRYGNNADLNDLDVSNVKDMSRLFQNSEFNGNISGWDVWNVKDMRKMFYGSKFTGDISGWDVSNVRDMSWMFKDARFNR